MTKFVSPASKVRLRTATFGKEMVVDGQTGQPRAVYRYSLGRTWGFGKGLVNFLMLNPSTADQHVDDPTIRRCIAFAMDWGYRQLTITNLFALRSTDPGALYSHQAPIGPENDAMIRQVAEVAEQIVCAWGVVGAFRDRGRHVLDMLSEFGRDRVYCFGKTKGDAPKHPLYLPGTSRLERWWV